MLRSLALLLVLAVSAPAAIAGDLDPPAGPVAPTMLPLSKVEPRIPIGPDTTPGDATAVSVITQPGSYVLTGNLAGEAGKNGIRIDATFATIDLNGFSLIGVPGSLNGISSVGRVNLHNGSSDSWGGAGIQVGEGTIRNVTAIGNGGNGIRALWGNLITECRAESNALHGFAVGDVSRIHACVAKLNTQRGIHLDGAGTITECVLYNNQQGGIEAGFAIIHRNYLFSNDGPSIEDHGGSTITNNTINSGATGILTTGDNSRIEANAATLCVTGVSVTGANCLILKNHATACTTNYDVAAGNSLGPIVNAAALGANTNPAANYE